MKIQEARYMENKMDNKERFLSIELMSKANLRNVTLANGPGDRVLVEGTIGELMQATFVEGIILEVIGNKGTLRIDLKEDEIKKTTGKLSGGND